MRRFRTLVDAHRDRVFSLGNLPSLTDDRLILARLEGDLNELMSKVVSDHHLIPAMIPGAD